MYISTWLIHVLTIHETNSYVFPLFSFSSMVHRRPDHGDRDATLPNRRNHLPHPLLPVHPRQRATRDILANRVDRAHVLLR